MLALLPVLVSALLMQITDIERTLSDDVREKLADGWTLVDVRGDYEELTLTLTKGNKIEQHVAHIEGANSAYRIDVVNAVPSDLRAPEPFLLLALSGGGGIELSYPCGRFEARGFILEGSAKGAAAARFVSKTLKSAVDLEGAHVEAGLATFNIELRDGTFVELRVTLDENIVVAAEARRHE